MSPADRRPRDGGATTGTAPGGRPGPPRRDLRPPAWERCLGCAHAIGAHGQPRGACHARRCDCGQFVWPDGGLQVASLRLCLRWLWASEAAGASGRATADRAGTMAALQALGRLLGPERTQRILAEEAESWWVRTGAFPPSVAFEAACPRTLP